MIIKKNKLMLFFFILIFFFNHQTLTKADDIRDLKIDGISIGDSLLDFFSKNEIEKTFVYKSNEYYLFTTDKYGGPTYDGIQFHAKTNDERYIIAALEGLKLFDGNFNECLSLKKKITNELSTVFKNTNKFDDSGDHSYDPSGESKYYRTNFAVDPASEYINVSVTCYDWSPTLEKRFADKLSVAISNNEFNYFTNNSAY